KSSLTVTRSKSSCTLSWGGEARLIAFPQSAQLAGTEVNSQGPKCLKGDVRGWQLVGGAHGIEYVYIAGDQARCKIEFQRDCNSPDGLLRSFDLHKNPEWHFIEDDLCPLVDKGFTVFFKTQRQDKTELGENGVGLVKVTHLDLILLHNFEVYILVCRRLLIRD